MTAPGYGGGSRRSDPARRQPLSGSAAFWSVSASLATAFMVAGSISGSVPGCCRSASVVSGFVATSAAVVPTGVVTSGPSTSATSWAVLGASDAVFAAVFAAGAFFAAFLAGAFLAGAFFADVFFAGAFFADVFLPMFFATSAGVTSG